MSPAPASGIAVRLQVEGFRPRLAQAGSISFDAAGGEILGFAGLVGAGRSELAESIFGVAPILAGEIVLDGKRLNIRHVPRRDPCGNFPGPRRSPQNRPGHRHDHPRKHHAAGPVEITPDSR